MERNRVALQLSKISNTITVIESQILAIESSEWNKSIVEALRDSTNAMKKMNSGVPINEIEDIVSELEQQLDNASEVTKLLSATDMPGISNSMTNSLTDMDLDEELDALLLDDEGVREVAESTRAAKAAKKSGSGIADEGVEQGRPKETSPPLTGTKVSGGIGAKKAQKRETPSSLFTHLVPAREQARDDGGARGEGVGDRVMVLS